MQILALGASLVIAVQIIYSIASGSAICLNQGCEIIEKLTTLSPLYFNVIGLIYFQIVFWAVRIGKKNQSMGPFDLTSLLLLAGLAVEGVLLAYQLFVARVGCSYCILIFLCVLVLNILQGRQQLLSGLTVLSAIIISFSLLSFIPGEVSSRAYSLEDGSYGLKSCAAPSKKIYLIFSSDCSHCLNVIKALDNCNSCDFYLNPVDRLDALTVNSLELNPTYSPEVNLLMLKILNIKEVPVLVVKNAAGYSFIKGEDNILNYVRSACFKPNPVLYFDQSLHSDGEKMSVMTEDGGECSLDIDCQDQ